MQKSAEILNELNLSYDYYEHEPILDYETARKVDEKYHLTGMESKCLFIKTKSDKYYVLVTKEGVRFDRKFMKDLLGEKASIATREELKEVTGYEAGCAAPFPYPKEVGYLVDRQIFQYEKFICSAGIPTESFEIPTIHLKKVYESVVNEVRYIDLPLKVEE